MQSVKLEYLPIVLWVWLFWEIKTLYETLGITHMNNVSQYGLPQKKKIDEH
jgi:hypothetical protein